MIARACALAALLGGSAHADVPKLAAVTPDVALGPHGELYAFDGKAGWLRRGASTIAGDVAAAPHGLAVTRDGEVFRLARDAWTAVLLSPHAKAIAGAGPRPLAAIGRAVYALDGAAPSKLPDAPAPVIALAGSASGTVIETDRDVLRLAGAAWKPIKSAPHHVAALLSDRFALAERGAGVVDLGSGRIVAWPGPLSIAASVAVGDTVYAAAVGHGADARGVELLVVRGAKVTREPLAIGPTGSVVAIAADARRVVVALRDGRLLVRASGAWTTYTVRDEPSPQHPGSPPAHSR
jgi:hypothetical protein